MHARRRPCCVHRPTTCPVSHRRDQRVHPLEGAKVLKKGKERSLVRTFSGQEIVVKNSAIRTARKVFAKCDRERQQTMLQRVGRTMEDVAATRIQAQIRGQLERVGRAGAAVAHAGTSAQHAAEHAAHAVAHVVEGGVKQMVRGSDLVHAGGGATHNKEAQAGTPRGAGQEKKKSSTCALL
jgi:hypothetical protein